MSNTTAFPRPNAPRTISRRAQRRVLRCMSDEDLMGLLQEDVVSAFETLEKRHSRRIYNFLFKYTKDHQVTEDLVQETFLRVYRSRHSYRRIAKFTTWLYTIAGNLARTEYRKRQRVAMLSLHSTTGRGEFEMEIPDRSHVPDEQVDLVLQHERVQRAIDHLPDIFREVVVLRGVQDLTYDEIQEITGIPLGTIKSRIHRGRSLLERMLDESAAS